MLTIALHAAHTHTPRWVVLLLAHRPSPASLRTLFVAHHATPRRYYPFHNYITDEICADLYDVNAAWRSDDSNFYGMTMYNTSMTLAGFDAQLAAWTCEPGAYIWYSSATPFNLTLYSKAEMDEVRASCGTSCYSACTNPDATSNEIDNDCLPCDRKRHRSLLFGSLPCC